MILYPAIDLKNGQCVRLRQGDMDQATVFNDDPAAQAQSFFAQGFSHLHVVDLDGAFAGKPMNGAAVDAILTAVPAMPLQLGGGIRDMATVEGWLGKGVARVIIGTAAVRDPAFVKAAAKAHPGKVAVGIDARDGMVAVEGWAEASTLTAVDLGGASRMPASPHHLHGYRPRRHASGAELGGHHRARQRSHHSVVASGGIASMADIER